MHGAAAGFLVLTARGEGATGRGDKAGSITEKAEGAADGGYSSFAALF